MRWLRVVDRMLKSNHNSHRPHHCHQLSGGCYDPRTNCTPVTDLTTAVIFQVADGALRCFASLADRFTRRSVDPAPLARHGLIQELLCRLHKINDGGHNTSLSSTPSKPSLTPECKASPSISTVISLLSTLCRGSPAVTHDLLRSKLPDAIESGLKGDER